MNSTGLTGVSQTHTTQLLARLSESGMVVSGSKSHELYLQITYQLITSLQHQLSIALTNIHHWYTYFSKLS